MLTSGERFAPSDTSELIGLVAILAAARCQYKDEDKVAEGSLSSSAMSDTFIEQDLLNSSRRLAIRSFGSRDLSRASMAIIDSGSSVLGLSIEYADTSSNRRRSKGKDRGKSKGVVRALAVATNDKVYYILFDDSERLMQNGIEAAFSDVLCGRHGLLAGFSMARLVLHINRDLRYHVKGFDLSTIYTSSGNPWSAADFLHKQVNNNIDQFRVNSLWHRDHDDMASACLRAWVSAKYGVLAQYNFPFTELCIYFPDVLRH